MGSINGGLAWLLLGFGVEYYALFIIDVLWANCIMLFLCFKETFFNNYFPTVHLLFVLCGLSTFEVCRLCA